jgi:hypothetical protein
MDSEGQVIKVQAAKLRKDSKNEGSPIILDSKAGEQESNSCA